MNNGQVGLTRDQQRSRRKRAVRAATVQAEDLALAMGEEPVSPEDLAELARLRPRTRGDCVDGLRPCPFVSCRHHLFLDVLPVGVGRHKQGSIRFTFPDLEPEQLVDSCALDLADLGGVRLEDVADALNVTRERVRQIELAALSRATKSARRHLQVFLAPDPDDHRTGDP